MSEQNNQEIIEDERERTIRFLKFAGFVFILVILWYLFDIAEAF